MSLPIVPSDALRIVCLALIVHSLCCASAGLVREPVRSTSAEAGVSAGITRFAVAVSTELNDRSARPPPSNTYSYETSYGPEDLAEPPVALTPTVAYSGVASTDCSGWVSFVINTVSPLHQAVLQSQRRLPEYNRAYPNGFILEEARRPWARAFVLANYFRTPYAMATGMAPVPDFEELRAGDIVAYAMGRYANPSDQSLSKPNDTGHTFIVMGPPSIVDPNTVGYSGHGTLSTQTAKVIAVPSIDSSSVVHFDPDARKNEQGQYSLPPSSPYPDAKPGGIGTGTLWFAVDEAGRVLQRRIGPGETYDDVVVGAGRLQSVISLQPEILDDQGDLVVKIFDNSPAELGGVSFGHVPTDLTGHGGIRLADGRLSLNGRNDFAGGVTVESGELVAESAGALGTGDVDVRGGALTLRRAAIGDTATLQLSDSLEDGAIRLDFSGSDVVGALRIGDNVHRCGTWGAVGSSAMFTDAVFSGSGVLQLTAEPIEACR
jgi:autotransporter-associated beta strand protein